MHDYDADPAKTEVVRYKGMSDPLLREIASSLLGVVSRRPEVSDKLFVEGASAMLAAHLVSKYSNIAQRRASPSQALSYDKLNRVLDLIDHRWAEEIGLDELAAEACLSPFHFARLFQKATGLSPHRYVTERRVREAKAKLGEGRLSLVEIALESGFGSQGNFNRIFRKHTGLTPGQFRIKQRSRIGRTRARTANRSTGSANTTASLPCFLNLAPGPDVVIARAAQGADLWRF
ncbi:AraC family transcriptional regulator [Mesorhizobium australicum]|uniref:AraC family transcriptional regulator n=1 Tax=Mesorhizobium australicum TaxID=536018 RepID=UPI00333A0F8B